MAAAVEGSRARQIINELKQQRAQFSHAVSVATGKQECNSEYKIQHAKDYPLHVKPPSNGSDSSRARTLANSLKESRMNLVKQVELSHHKFHHTEKKSLWLKAHDSMGSGNTEATEAMSPSCSVSEGDHHIPSSGVTAISGDQPIVHMSVQEGEVEESDTFTQEQRDGAQPNEELSLPLQYLDHNLSNLREPQSEQFETQPAADVLSQKDSLVKGEPEEDETGDLTENHEKNNYEVRRRSSPKRPKSSSSSSSSSKTKQKELQLRVEQAKQAKEKVDEYFRIKEELDSENWKPRATTPPSVQRELTEKAGSQGAAASDQEIFVVVNGPKRLQELYASEVDQMRQELLSSSENIYRSNHHRRDQMNRMYLKSMNFDDRNKTLQLETEDEREDNLRSRDVLVRLKNEIAAVQKKAKRKTITTIKEGDEDEEDEEGEEVHEVPSSRAFKSAKTEGKLSLCHDNEANKDSLEYSCASSSSSPASSLKQKSRVSAKSSKGKAWLPVLTENTVEDLLLQTSSTLQSSCLEYDDDDDE
jgi:hypothetical protein